MAVMAAELCAEAHSSGRFFSLMHPGRSIALDLESWQRLCATEGVFVSYLHTRMFHDSCCRQSKVVIHNMPSLCQFISRRCKTSQRCSRTDMAHTGWKGPCVGLRKLPDHELDEPRGFCEAYAHGLHKHCLDTRMCNVKFVEIFCGPCATLSNTVAMKFGITPFSFDSLPGPTRAEKLAGAEELSVSAQDPSRVVRLEIEQGAGPQGAETLKVDHHKALQWCNVVGCERIALRLRELNWIKCVGESSAVLMRQKSADLNSSWTARKLGLKPRTELMKKIQERCGIEDTDVPDLCRTGMPIVGAALESIPQKISLGELRESAPERRSKMIDRVRYMAKKSSHDLTVAIWEKTQKEVTAGTMGPPMTEQEATSKYGPFFNIVPSVGLEQGVDAEGNPKFRRIDDHSACMNNQAAERRQKIPMAMVDYLAVMVKALALSCEKPSCRVHVATEDMKAAYRQIPLSDCDIPLCITAVYNPHEDTVELHEMYGQPFGAGHSVPNFYRVAEWLCRGAVRLFHLLVDHFFDDFFIVEAECCSTSALFVLREYFRLLGFMLDQEKSQAPAEIQAVLGVLINTQHLHEQRAFRVQPKETRIKNMLMMISHILDRDFLPPSMAASLLGKYGFLCSTLFGKVGRCCTGPIRERQYSNSAETFLSADIRSALKLMAEFAVSAPSRRVSIQPQAPIIMYTDASDVPERVDARFVVGACLFVPSMHGWRKQFTYWIVPHEVVNEWLPKKTMMGQLEILAAVVAVETWAPEHRERQCLLFIDNDSAAATLVKGFSRKTDSCSLSGDFWLRAAKLATDIYIDRVESKSNIADGPSRLMFQEVWSYGCSYVPPQYTALLSRSAHPTEWFGAP